MFVDVTKYATKRIAAKTLHRHLGENFEDFGGKTARLLTPDESEQLGTGRNWRGMWEEGPYEWAIGLTGGTSMFGGETGKWSVNNPEILLTGAENWFCEPYYRFDLCFFDC